MKIICDSREQQVLFIDKKLVGKKKVPINNRYPQHEFEIRKIDEGDYIIPELEHCLVCERKNSSDLYGSIVQGHIRFTDELMRARLKGKRVYIFVECSRHDFLNDVESDYYKLARNYGGWERGISAKTLEKMLESIEEKYQPIFVWCNGRLDMENKIIRTFMLWKRLKEVE